MADLQPPPILKFQTHPTVCRYISTYTGTVTDDDQEAWNITKLNTILDYVSEDYGIKIEGEI